MSFTRDKFAISRIACKIAAPEHSSRESVGTEEETLVANGEMGKREMDRARGEENRIFPCICMYIYIDPYFFIRRNA